MPKQKLHKGVRVAKFWAGREDRAVSVGLWEQGKWACKVGGEFGIEEQPSHGALNA